MSGFIFWKTIKDVRFGFESQFNPSRPRYNVHIGSHDVHPMSVWQVLRPLSRRAKSEGVEGRVVEGCVASLSGVQSLCPITDPH